MKQALALALAMTIGQSSVAWAGESLLTSATRIAREAVAHERVAAREVAVTSGATVVSRRPKAAAQPQAGVLGSDGMSRRGKLLIGLAAVAGFVGTVWAIDRGVEDNTPSSLGTRQD